MEDRAKFDAVLFAPMPGRRVTDPDQLASETADLRRMAQWATAARGG